MKTGLPTFFLLAAALLLLGAGPAHASERYALDIKIISAQPDGAGIDSALQRFRKDFSAMPYKSFKLLDSHRKVLSKGETVSMQFPGPGRRFMKVTSHGSQGGKHSFGISIDALHFRTSVKIPNNGTLIVGGPRHQRGVILLALTARTQ